jgi:hypothetical protein
MSGDRMIVSTDIHTDSQWGSQQFRKAALGEC